MKKTGEEQASYYEGYLKALARIETTMAAHPSISAEDTLMITRVSARTVIMDCLGDLPGDLRDYPLLRHLIEEMTS